VLIRPSYVLSGAAMNVVSTGRSWRSTWPLAVLRQRRSTGGGVGIHQEAKEVSCLVADHGDIVSYAISETWDLPACTPAAPPCTTHGGCVGTVRKLKIIAGKDCPPLRNQWPFNIQFLEKNREIRVIGCNSGPRAAFPDRQGRATIIKDHPGAVGESGRDEASGSTIYPSWA
jgi:carbamoyl-phosphate synthase large subunit